MTKLEMLNVFLTDRLTAAAEEIFRAVKGTIIDYQGEIIRSKEENDRLRRLLNIAVQRVLLQPDHRATHHQHTEDVLSPEQQHCEQEWSPGLGQAQEDPEATQVKEEEQELRTSQEEEQIQRLESDTIIESIFTPPDGKSDCDQEKEPLPAQHYQTHLVNNIERDCLVRTISKEIKTENDGEAAHCTAELTSNIQTSFAVYSDPHAAQSDNHIDTADINGVKRKGQYSGSEAPQSKGTHHSNVGQSLHKLHSKSGDTNSMLPQQELTHQTQGTQRVYCCKDCGKCFSFSCQLEVHMRWHTKERPFNCAVCRKGFTTTSMLRRHYRIHTGEKPFRCHICGKCFNQSAHLNTHFRLHPGEKPSRWKPGPHSKR